MVSCGGVGGRFDTSREKLKGGEMNWTLFVTVIVWICWVVSVFVLGMELCAYFEVGEAIREEVDEDRVQKSFIGIVICSIFLIVRYF